MKLINPTDDQLDAAFAEKVAGWTKRSCPTRETDWWVNEAGLGIATTLRFTHSADAVLPWLEKYGATVVEFGGFDDGLWRVYVGTDEQAESPEWFTYSGFNGESETMAKAAVIALLRAHGAEVEMG